MLPYQNKDLLNNANCHIQIKILTCRLSVTNTYYNDTNYLNKHFTVLMKTVLQFPIKVTEVT